MLVILGRSQAWSHFIILSFSHTMSCWVFSEQMFWPTALLLQRLVFWTLCDFCATPWAHAKLGRISGIHPFTLLFNHLGRRGNVCVCGTNRGENVERLSVYMCLWVSICCVLWRLTPKGGIWKRTRRLECREAPTRPLTLINGQNFR